MKRPSFFQGVLVAAILGFFASAVVATLAPFMGTSASLRIVVPLAGLAYVLYLLGRSPERVGRVSTVAFWSAIAAVTWWLAPPLALYLMIHVGAIWLVRSLYFHSGVIPALMDLGLCALGICAAVWAVDRSGSIFLATWCFFLVQASFVAIPSTVRTRHAGQDGTADAGDFERARRQADEALRQLFTR